ncbi:uncharacterized protein LOC111636477 [Centruroides sculpturatus]|uniref:uncharacterized protein LOC111636477 n=1 Tax=Centruroides sculpturatus TaxID=218467 RepID=UPI000C6CC2EB|nr:uncharacterized protein LOC111636477 [Centruroides sculpturatus]
MIPIIFLLFVCRNVLSDIIVEEGNAYVDNLLQSALKNQELVTLQLPDHDISIARKFLHVAEILLREGKIFGLPNISRNDDVQIAEEENSTLIISNLNLNDIELRYQVNFTFFRFKLKPINITGFMDNKKVILKLRINKETRELSVVNLLVSKLSGFRINFKIFGNAFRWLSNAFRSMVINILKNDITSLVQRKLREVFEKEAERKHDIF